MARLMTGVEARMLPTCPACGTPKASTKTDGPGAPLVCWGDCWRGPGGFKWSGERFEKWLAGYLSRPTIAP